MKVSAGKLIILLLALNCVVEYISTREIVHLALSLALILAVAVVTKVSRRSEVPR